MSILPIIQNNFWCLNFFCKYYCSNNNLLRNHLSNNYYLINSFPVNFCESPDSRQFISIPDKNCRSSNTVFIRVVTPPCACHSNIFQFLFLANSFPNLLMFVMLLQNLQFLLLLFLEAASPQIRASYIHQVIVWI